MKCGNCKQDHGTIDQVKACYGVEFAPRPTATKGWPATQRQLDLIKKLVDEKGADPVNVEGLTKKDASNIIDLLIRTKPKAKVQDEVTVTSSIPNGTYTVVFSGTEFLEDNVRRTIRLRSADWATDLPAGSQVAEFLSGSDNETDFTGFAFVVKGRPRVWKRYRDDSKVRAALDFLLEGGLDKARESGYTYALASSRCFRCGHKLTVPASIHRGLGPVCAGVYGTDSDIEDTNEEGLREDLGFEDSESALLPGYDEEPWEPTCSICDGYHHGGTCPLEDSGRYEPEERML